LQRKRRAIPLIRGSIIGEMLDARAIGGRVSPLDVLEKYRKKYRVLFREEQEKYGDIVGDIKRIYAGYERKYKEDPWTYRASEHLLTIDLLKDVRYIGYIDKKVDDAEKRRWLVDHKAYRFIPNDDDRFSDLQNVFYIWAHKIQHPNEDVTGFCWDYLRTKPPTIPEQLKNGELSQRANIDTDYHTYLAEVKRLDLKISTYREILDKLKKASTSRFYRRIYLPSPSKEMIKHAVDDAKSTAAEIRDYGGTVVDRNMTRDCPRMCEYYNLCQAEYRGLDSKYVRKAEYEEKPPKEEEIADETE
jgi:hypothetical protein